jgi:ZIP family zinc transporter
MSDLLGLIALSSLMGLSIFLSLPIVLSRRISPMTIATLNAVAIGMLVFLIADVYSDAAPALAAPTAYLTVPGRDLVFLLGVLGAFLFLFFAEHRPAGAAPFSPSARALVIAGAIGVQNLTEGLVFGSLWAQGALVGLMGVVFVGFFLQNISEGFPITAPLLGEEKPRMGVLVSYFLLGGLPTIFGSVIGYYWSSITLVLLFEAVAIGAILYAILPMLRAVARPAETPERSYRKQRLVYLGILGGFVLGFLVNAV